MLRQREPAVTDVANTGSMLEMPRMERIGQRLLELTRAGDIDWEVTDNRWSPAHPAYACQTDEGTVIVDRDLGGGLLRLVDAAGDDIDTVTGSAHSLVAVPDADGFYDAASLRQENLIYPPGPPYSEGFPAVLDELFKLTRR
jgi:hypothetical protein